MYLLAQGGLFPEAAGARQRRGFGLFIVTQAADRAWSGVLVAAVLAAAMSTLSSSLNSSANAVVTDFYRPLRPAPPGEVVRAPVARDDGRVGRRPDGVSRSPRTSSAATRAWSNRCSRSPGFTTGLLLGLFILGSLRRPVRSWAALTGLVCGFSGGVGGLAAVRVRGFGRCQPVRHRLAWPWFAPVGAGTTVLVALVLDHFGSRVHRLANPNHPACRLTIR